MDSTEVLIDRLVNQFMVSHNLPSFDPDEMAGMLLLVLEDIWGGDVHPESLRILAQMIATLKLHHADGVMDQLGDRMKP